MAKSTTYLHDEDDADFFGSDDLDPSVNAESETRKREQKTQNRHAARQLLDSRKEELWLKQQLNDWDDEFEDSSVAD